MKCIVISNQELKKKGTEEKFHIAKVAFIRNNSIEVQEVFNLDNVFSGDIVDVQNDMKGFLVSYEVVGKADSIDLLIGELQHL